MSNARSMIVTGAEGQLGSELCRQLGFRAAGWRRQDCDLLDTATLIRKIADARPAVVINTAAYTAVDRAEQEPDLCMAVNAGVVAALAEACANCSALLVQISTDYVFGRDPHRRMPWRETDEPGPINVYGRSKLSGEQHATRCSRHLIVRTCGLYGRRAKPTQANFVDTMLRLASERDRLRIVADQHCTPSYVPHVARGILALIDSRATGTYHVVNEGSTTWYDFAAEIFRQAGKSIHLERISTAEYGAAAARPAYSVLDTSRYRNHVGSSLPRWEDALKEYLTTIRARSATTPDA